MAKVYILCGKIASGKTTYANKIKQQNKAVSLSCDELMLALFDGCLGNKHDETVQKCALYFYKLAEELIEIDVDVILDFGYWTKRERAEAKAYFANRNILAELHYIEVTEDRRLEQLNKRNESLTNSTSRVYLIKEDLRQYLDAKFEQPTDDEIDVIINE